MTGHPYRDDPSPKPSIYCWISEKLMFRLDQVVAITIAQDQTIVHLAGADPIRLYDDGSRTKFYRAWKIYEEMTR